MPRPIGAPAHALAATGVQIVTADLSTPTSCVFSARPLFQKHDRPWQGILAFLAERVGFEPTWGDYAPIRFRVGAVMTASVPLRGPRILYKQ